MIPPNLNKHSNMSKQDKQEPPLPEIWGDLTEANWEPLPPDPWDNLSLPDWEGIKLPTWEDLDLSPWEDVKKC